MTPPRDRRPIIGVLAAMASGWTGARLLTLALPWFVLSSTGSTAATGLVVFAQMGPYVTAQLLSGPLIDKIGARKVSIIGDAAATVALTAVPLLHMASMLSIPVLMAVIAVVGATDGPANVAKSVLVPAASRAAGMRFERATGLSGAIERGASTVGPAVAGVVVGALGGVNALWITAGLTAVGGVIIAVFVADVVPEPNETDASANYLTRLRSGAQFLRRDGLLRSIALMITATNLLDQAFAAVLLPVWVKTSGYGPEIVGLLMAVFSATAVLASLAAAAWGHRLPRRLVYLVGFMVGGIPRFIALAFGSPLWLLLTIFAIGGLGSGFINPIIGAIRYERIPEAMLGRVSTLIRSLAWSGIPFGGLVGSLVITLGGVPGAMLIVGGAYFLCTLLPGIRPEWAEMNRPVDRQQAEGKDPANVDTAH